MSSCPAGGPYRIGEKLDGMKILLFLAACSSLLSGCSLPIGSTGDTQSTSYVIPSRYMPPDGYCRIWIPDRSRVEQPPPGNCARLRKEVPSGAFLVRG